ncbi:restriction endonuclease subunit S [Sphingomonas kaistensis]|uniref:Restriction endonuclease subunit S n=1 Tax=Sphingomonas kaistensis TaxID=298708 RepID=A0ABZ2FXK9_9SPHN
MSWPIVPLGDIAEIERDGVAPEEILPGTPYLGLEHIEQGGRILSRQQVASGELASTKFRFSSDHILYGKLRPYLAKIALPDFAGICSTDIVPLRPGEEVNRQYLAHFLRQPSMVGYAASRATGANLPRLSPKALAKFGVPLPPLPEQKRIAAILDKAEDLCRKQSSFQCQLRSIVAAEFEHRFSAPHSWQPLGEVVVDTLIGLVRGSEEFGRTFAIPYVRMDAISTDGAYLPEKVQNTEASAEELSRYAVVEGDLLFNTRNSRELVGKSAVYRGSGAVVFNNNIMRIRLRDGWNSRFLDSYLRSSKGRQQLEQRKSGTTSVWAVYWSKLQTLPVPAVEPEEQANFGEFADEVHARLTIGAKRQTYLDNLFAALQHRAFRGEL